MPNTRVRRLQGYIQEAGLDAVALVPGPNLLYLTGLVFHLMERPIVALIPGQGEPLLILPELERAKGQQAAGWRLFTYGEAEQDRLSAFHRAAAALGRSAKTIGVESTALRFLEFQLLRAALPRARIVAGDAALNELRVLKEPQELAAMERAVQVAQVAMAETLPLLRPGMTEKEVAAELVLQLLRAGSEAQFPFSPIVASGPQSALPHATPTERPLQPGDMLIIDWGARVEGYVSDLTRTFAIGPVDPELQRVHQLVLAANQAAQEAVRPGATCSQIDQAARRVIEAGGYGPYFIHRTGHGLGLAGHEPPYIAADNPQPLRPGMAFTIEPGVYLPGRGGVRIEDDVVVEGQGGRSLSDLARELEVIE
jgi:Xaa-Pro dipeptidase